MGKDLKGKELGIGITQRKDGLYQARYKDRFGKNHYHETNSMGIGAQKAIADAFADVVSRF